MRSISPQIPPEPDDGSRAEAQLSGGTGEPVEPTNVVDHPRLSELGQIPGGGRSILSILLELGFVDAETARSVANEVAELGISAEALLLRRKAITEEQLARATASRYGYEFVDLAGFNVDMAAASLVPVAAARRLRSVPIAFDSPGRLIVATADPANVIALDDIKVMTGCDCSVVVAPAGDIDTLVARLMTVEHSVQEAVDEHDAEEGPLEAVAELSVGAEDAPVVKLVNGLLSQAVAEGASDIHFEREESDMRVRFRVDGVLHEAARVPRRMISGAISRVKIMAELDIAEKRVPQDGRVGLVIDDRRIDLRVVTIPTPRGEGASLRILDKTNVLLTLDELGITGESRRRFEHAFNKPHGAVFVTGPTGSGKSTSLYAALNVLNDVERKIITIEDPVEYQLPGINQIQVSVKRGLTFATGLRSMLRADPDIIMVGEIRDRETAQIAVEAALTGHLVLSTLHTNDAPNALTRLTEMGIEPFLTASALDCVVAQRLTRRLCDHCKRKETLSVIALRSAGFDAEGSIEAFEPTGCSRCGASGYKGRVGLYEVMTMSDEIRELLISRASGDEIGRVAREQGMQTLREDGLGKIRAGLTSVEEVIRVSS